MSTSSVTTWITHLRNGNRDAATRLWERYFSRLVRLARDRLNTRLCRAFDEEDVALSALNSCIAAIEAGRYPDLHDREDLWRLLFTITLRKAHDRVRRENAQRRGGENNPVSLNEDLEKILERFVSPESDPAWVAAMVDELEHLMNRLPEELQALAQALLEGWTPGEIADGLECSERTVQRRRELIRQIWREDAKREDARD